jgi:hypothetical protein
MNAFETSDTLAAIAPALAAAQGAVEGAVKGKANPAFKSKYADLSSVWEACREALTTNGLSVIQSPGEIADGRMGMTTMLLHASGEWVRGHLTIPLGKVDAQAAFVGVAPEDDDGNAAAKAAPANDGKRTELKVPTLTERADRLETALQGLKPDQLQKAWDMARNLRDELAEADPNRLTALRTLYDFRKPVEQEQAA